MNSIFRLALALAALFCLQCSLQAADPVAGASSPKGATEINPLRAQPAKQVSHADDEPPADSTEPEEEDLSEAEHIAQLERAIETDQKELATLEQEMAELEQEYQQCQEEFKRLDDLWAARKKQIKELKDTGRTEEASTLEADSKKLQADRQTAEENFDLAIQERKTMREVAATLTKKVQQGQAALKRLTEHKAEESESESEPTEPARPSAANSEKSASKDHEVDAKDSEENESQENIEEEEDEHARELADAQEEAKEKIAAAREAAHAARSVEERLEALRKNIALEEQLLQIATSKAQRNEANRVRLEQEISAAQANGGGGLADLQKELAQVLQRQLRATDDTTESRKRLDELQLQLHDLAQEREAALREAKRMDEAAAEARDKVASLKNPFNPQNMLQWAFDHAPKLLTIVIGTLVLYLLAKISTRRIAETLARGGSRGTPTDRQNRAMTLVGVFRNIASLVVIGGGTLMALDEVGIPILPLMGGAAVFGLAVAFGAQNLIRDYFSGFMVLLEDQYGINDVVRIGDIAGVVEKITLRLTVVRDLEGAVHFVPHGTISTVSNKTHSWSRAVIEIGVAYQEDVDYVMSVIEDVAHELRRDPAYGPSILGDPEMMGLENLAANAATIKFALRTHPMKRWPVRQELLRRIKMRFDELGIGPPGSKPVLPAAHATPPNVQQLPAPKAKVEKAA